MKARKVIYWLNGIAVALVFIGSAIMGDAHQAGLYIGIAMLLLAGWNLALFIPLIFLKIIAMLMGRGDMPIFAEIAGAIGLSSVLLFLLSYPMCFFSGGGAGS